jgi:hypothetical protein
LSTTSLSIAGQVIEQKSGLPLAGVLVKWTFSPIHTRAKNHRRNEIGSALTNDEGRFFIDAAANPEGKAALCGIAGEKRNGTTYLCLVDQAFVLEIDRSGGGRGVEATIRRRLIPRIHRELLNWYPAVRQSGSDPGPRASSLPIYYTQARCLAAETGWKPIFPTTPI